MEPIEIKPNTRYVVTEDGVDMIVKDLVLGDSPLGAGFSGCHDDDRFEDAKGHFGLWPWDVVESLEEFGS